MKKEKGNNESSLAVTQYTIDEIINNPILRNAFDTFPYVAAIYDKHYNILFLNKSGYEFTGFKRTEPLNRKCYEMIGRTSPCENCRRSIEQKEPSFEYKSYLDDSGNNIHLKSSFVYNSEGEIEYIIGYIRFFKYDKACFSEEYEPANLEVLIAERTDDLIAVNEELQAEVMERIHIENELRESQLTFNTLIETIPEIVYFKDSHGKNIVANKAFENFIGLEKKDIIGKTDRELFSDFLASSFQESDDEVMRTKKAVRTSADFIDPQGNKKFLETIKTPIIGDDGEIEGIVGLSRDITDQKISEDSLKISRNELEQTYDYIRNLMELTPIATVSLDAQQRITTVNQKAIDMLGYDLDELIGAPFIGLISKPEKFVQGSERSLVLEFVTKAGTSIVANVSQSLIDKEGMDEKTVVTLQALSDLRGIFVDPLQEESIEQESVHDDKYIDLEPGNVYFIDDVNTDETYRLFSNMVKSGAPGLCITRQNPARVRKTYGLLKTPFIWFTKNQTGDIPFIDSSELYKLQPTILNFIEKVDSGVVFLDGLEYLSLDNDIRSVIKAVEEVNDSVMDSNSSMIIHVNSLALDTKDFYLMTRWMKPIKCI
ncbi:DUF835 domain-containing protein [Methanolobus profundi]|uniref:PAS domain S-box-containing protein n=1 Tax=Methanolobus profundi TaxID=487685 RepID=A0A1I4T4N2_9EURY|nr:DUF835 domain-containing protein [Methanolobus profundi]SFM71510.1 PAS domain S-box-containing protein [Methanolobus profundi]